MISNLHKAIPIFWCYDELVLLIGDLNDCSLDFLTVKGVIIRPKFIYRDGEVTLSYGLRLTPKYCASIAVRIAKRQSRLWRSSR